MNEGTKIIILYNDKRIQQKNEDQKNIRTSFLMINLNMIHRCRKLESGGWLTITTDKLTRRYKKIQVHLQRITFLSPSG